MILFFPHDRFAIFVIRLKKNGKIVLVFWHKNPAPHPLDSLNIYQKAAVSWQQQSAHSLFGGQLQSKSTKLCAASSTFDMVGILFSHFENKTRVP